MQIRCLFAGVGRLPQCIRHYGDVVIATAELYAFAVLFTRLLIENRQKKDVIY